MKIGIIGDDEFVTGFRLAGVDKVITAARPLDGPVSRAIEEKEIGVLVMKETDLQSLAAKTRKLVEKTIKPVVIAIPEREGKQDIRELIKRSIGVDLWKT
jgi:V/A-type H+-transporting ATPase subunit F